MLLIIHTVAYTTHLILNVHTWSQAQHILWDLQAVSEENVLATMQVL